MGCTSSSSVLDIRRTFVKSGNSMMIWSLTEQERILIKRTWRILSKNRADVGASIFLELFRRRPDTKQMFQFRHVDMDVLPEDSNFKCHVNKVMQTLGALVDGIDQLDTTMAPVLFDMGVSHCCLHGFDLELCEVFTESLLDTWGQTLGKRFRVDVKYAWQQLFEFMVLKMGEGCLHKLSINRAAD